MGSENSATRSRASVLLALFLVGGCTSPNFAATQYAKTAQLENAGDCVDTSVLQLGQCLRAAIDARYKLLKETRQLSQSSHGRNSITDVVEKYVRPGMRLENTKAILQAAGFRVGEIGEHVLYPHGIYAEIKPYDDLGFFRNSSVGVAIQFDTERKDERIVRSIEASIFLTSL
jgi:hypothetical protein